ncbi:EAL and HDOD domain-containing protein [Sporosarcina aquimarina]|uniref:HDOD domain-containing protein n=1 Tax=Sporosarcina aquimarina TaxID=114975 RepID=A0ABU4G1Q9_9BACL|nr:HDOD domain-containing protein [Sporosarcina aquimarina]MDW0110801.1 HDOD domain-containing protein [Sporosarcina aquimarina]
MEQSVFVGRQPILDRNGNLFGYELLYRNSQENRFPNVNPEKATIGVLVNTFLTIGANRVTGSYPSFINFTGELLAQDFYSQLNPKRIIIEVLEDVEITPALVSRLRDLKQQGFKIALDDFVLNEQYATEKTLFTTIDYVKVDFIQSDRQDRQRIQHFVRSYPNVKLLAEKIETAEEYEEAKVAGYELFQGYYFATPEVVAGAAVPSVDYHTFQVMDKLNGELPKVKDVAALITQDMSLTYKLLRFINTYAFGIPRKITSIQQAIMLIGLQETKKWLYIITMHQLGEGEGNGAVKALVDYSIVRAKLCELLAKRAGYRNSDEFFLVGMFSLLNLILSKEWDEIEQDIPLSDAVMKTLTGERTKMAPFIELAQAVERMDVAETKRLCSELEIPMNDLCVYSQEANRWGRRLH